MDSSDRRRVVGVAAPLATIAFVVGPVLVAWGSLPEPMAVGWQGSGAPTESASPATFLVIMTVGAVLSAALFALAAFRPFTFPIYNGTAAVIAASIAPVLAVVSISTVLLNRGVAVWTEVGSPGTVWVAATIAAPMLAIVPVGWLMRDSFKTASTVDGPSPSAGLSLAETETAAWHSQASSSWPRLVAGPMAAIGVLGCVAGVFAVGAPGIILGLTSIGTALVVMAFASVSVFVDRRGLSVRYGPLPWPVSRIPLSSIEEANAMDVRPMEHGGWGYRGSRKLFGKAAVVVRGGEGIRLALRDGTEFVVTVDDADRGAGVLNDLRAASV